MVASKLKKKNLKIEFHFIEVTVGIEEKKISKWINHVVQQHQKDPNELNIIFFTNQEIDTIQIDNIEKYHYDLFDYDAPLPLDNCDSIFIHFDDNKVIKYLPGDCVEKNIFCTST